MRPGIAPGGHFRSSPCSVFQGKYETRDAVFLHEAGQVALKKGTAETDVIE